jgi:hypothetical protein
MAHSVPITIRVYETDLKQFDRARAVAHPELSRAEEIRRLMDHFTRSVYQQMRDNQKETPA